MTNKHEVGKIKDLKMIHSESLETVHTHTHTLYVYQIDRNLNKSNKKIDGRTCKFKMQMEAFNTS